MASATNALLSLAFIFSTGCVVADPVAGGTPGPQAEVPEVMHWCALHCFTLHWQDGRYVTSSGSVYVVEQFTRSVVVMQRTDYAANGAVTQAFTVTGQVSERGNQIVNGVVAWTYPRGTRAQPFHFQASWGDALEALPGSDHERARRAHLPPPEGQSKVCGSSVIRQAMATLERQAMRDPNGAMLRVLAQAMGMNVNLGSMRIVFSRVGTDNGRYTGQDPGSFVCRGFFIHTGAQVEATREADEAAQLSAEQAQKLLDQNPAFVEWFKVKQVSDGQYSLLLLPSSIELSRPYSTEFTYRD